MSQKLLNISTIILTLILWGLQMLPDDNESGIVVEWLKDNVYWIAGCSGGLVVLIHILDMTWGRDANLKKWLKIFLKHIADEHLVGDLYGVRISILRRQSGYIVFLKTVWYYVFLNFINNWKKWCWRQSLCNIAWHLFSDYLTVYVRYSYPKSKKSYVYFRLSDNASRQEYNGRADKCYREGIELSVSTSCIKDIDVTKDLSNLSSKERNKVKSYMRKSYFADQFYSTLRLMRNISNNLYAVPIALNDQTIWGVVIVDNCRQEKHDFKADLQDYMPSYMKIINFSLSSIKKS